MEERKVIRKLVLVFNADAGALNALIDSSRKLLRINGCSLCTITHGILGERSDWKTCRTTIGVDVEYLHRDELDLETESVVGDALPCILAQTDDGLQMLLEPAVLDRCAGSVPDLKGRLLHHAARLGLVIGDPAEGSVNAA